MSDPHPDALDSELLHLAWHLRQQAKFAFDAVGLQASQGMMLVHIYEGIDQPGELAQKLGFNYPTVSNQLTILDAQGLIERRQAPEDGRRVDLQLTLKGHKTVTELLKAWRTRISEDSRLSSQDYASFEAWCQELLTHQAQETSH